MKDRLGQTGGRLLRLAALGSQLINVVLFDGSPDETVSGRSYRQGVIQGDAKWCRRRQWIEKVFFWDDDHCKKSHEQDRRMAESLMRLYL